MGEREREREIQTGVIIKKFNYTFNPSDIRILEKEEQFDGYFLVFLHD